MSRLYVLELEGGKYYVGVSDDPERRFFDHMNGRGSAWTRMHYPIRIIEVRSMTSSFEEDMVTKEYMVRYGIDNVRGGSYVLLRLPPEAREALKREIRMANNACLRCGRTGHFVNDCYAKTDSEGDPIGQVEATESHRQSRSLENRWRDEGRCLRCGALSHYAAECFARRDINGDPIESRPTGSVVEENRHRQMCRRCGRTSHTIDRCFATTDVDGRSMR